MRRILFEIPSAQTAAWIVAVAAVLFALYHALRKPAADAKGNREPFPVGSVAGGLVVAALLVWGVALNDDGFREDRVVLKNGKVVPGKVVSQDEKVVKIRAFPRPLTIPRGDVAEIRTNVAKGIPIYSYGFMMMVAFATAIYLSSVRARNAGVDPNVILDLGLTCMVSGILGARLFYVFQYSEQFRGRPLWEYFKVWEGGIVFYGGLIGAFVAGTWFVVRRKVPVRRIMDIVAPAIPLGVAFARFGCYLNGCCFGRRVDGDFPLAVTFGEGSHALHRHQHLFGLSPESTCSLPVHPTQLYSSLAAFTVFVVASIYYHVTRKRRVDGEVFLLFAVLYPIGRFVMESFREDTDPVFGTGLTISQNISALILLVAIPLFVWTQVVKFKRLRSGEGTAPADAAGESKEV